MGDPLPEVLCLAHQAHRGGPLTGVLLWDSASVTSRGKLDGVLLCSSVHQAFDRPASLLFGCWCWRVARGRLWWWLHPLCMTQQYHLASMAAQLSSTGISHHNLLPHISSICLSTVNSSPRPWVAPQSLSSSFPLCLPEDLSPCPEYVWLRQGLSDSHSILAATDQPFHSLP